MMQLDHDAGELLLVGLLVLVEFHDAFLEDVEERVDAVVVGLLLESGCES
jgi:hypothetical protein